MALTAHALTTLAAVKTELSISDSGSDDILTELINRASGLIEAHCDRHFEYSAAVAEAAAGFGLTMLQVARTPLLSLTSITYDTATVDSDSYSIHSAGAGTIYREGGWVWTAGSLANIARDPLPGTEQKLYTVTYAGGYVTQPQVDDDGTLTRTLPYDLEQACILAVVQSYRQLGRDRAIKSESLLKYSVSYGSPPPSSIVGGSGLPPEVEAMLNPYVRIPAA